MMTGFYSATRYCAVTRTFIATSALALAVVLLVGASSAVAAITVEFADGVSNAVNNGGANAAAERRQIEREINEGLKNLGKTNAGAKALYDSNQTIRIVCYGDPEAGNLKPAVGILAEPAETLGDFDAAGNPKRNGKAIIVIDCSTVQARGGFYKVPAGGFTTALFDVLVHELLHATHKNRIHAGQGTDDLGLYRDWEKAFKQALAPAPKSTRTSQATPSGVHVHDDVQVATTAPVSQVAPVASAMADGESIWTLTAGGNISRVDVNSNFGIGTVVSGGIENFGALTARFVWREGVDVGGEVELMRPGILLGPQSRAMIDFGFSHAWGSASGSGSATVGAGGVSKIGLTFLEFDSSSGIGSIIAGDNLYSSVNFNNKWTSAFIGYCETFAPRGSDGPQFHIGGALTFEYFDQDFSARADILRGGSSLASQETRGETTDNYYGYEFKAGVTIPVTETFSAGIEAYITPSLHTGKASLFQFSDFSGGISQQFEFSNNGFAVSGGIRANLKYDITSSFSLKASYEYSQLSGVSEVHVPANPGEQPAYFDGGPIGRHFGRIEAQLRF